MWKLLGSHVFTMTTRHYYDNQFQKLEAAKSAYLRWRESVRRCFQQYLPSNSGPAAVLWLGMGPISWSLAQLHHNCSPAARTATFLSAIVPHYQYWYTRTHARLWNWGSVTVTSHTWPQGSRSIKMFLPVFNGSWWPVINVTISSLRRRPPHTPLVKTKQSVSQPNPVAERVGQRTEFPSMGNWW